ncbi:MAG: helix-turn-helix transcriptional regulator [Patescibacteria group bacterium]|nr:helix-turn-helix transcriptional regulator [Patescibacteria group bacterium]
MSTVANRDGVSNRAVPLAVAVFSERIRALPQADRDDLNDLVKVMLSAECDEDVQAAVDGMVEILDQRPSCVENSAINAPGGALDKWMDYVGGRIREFRTTAGLTQEELAVKAGLPQSHISKLENRRHSPSHLTIQKIAKALGIKASQLDPSA